MAVVRHFAFNMLRMLDDKRSIKLRRKRAPEATNTSNTSSSHQPVNPDSKP